MYGSNRWRDLTICTLAIVALYFLLMKGETRRDVYSETSQLYNTVERPVRQAIAEATAFAAEKGVISTEDSVEDGNFVLPPKRVKPKEEKVFASSSGLRLHEMSREQAERSADNALAAIGSVPHDWIESRLKDPASAVSAVNDLLLKLPQNTPQLVKDELLALTGLYHYRMDTLRAEQDLSWPVTEVAGWKAGMDYFKSMDALLDEQQYKAVFGITKDSNQIARIPNPYDDPTTPSSEIFATLPIRHATHGLIKTDQELFEYVDPRTAVQVADLYRDLYREQAQSWESFQRGEITAEEDFARHQAALKYVETQVKALLTYDEGRLFGLERIWENESPSATMFPSD